MSEPPRNLTRTRGHVDRREREQLLGQQGTVVWFTGLSASGKSTLVYAVERALVDRGHAAFALDGDNVRMGLCRDLGFAPDDRQENIRRVGEVAALFARAGMIVLTAFISPYRADRAAAREMAPGHFVEVYLDVPVAVCEERDPKGLYARARAGELEMFTGVSAPYEAPDTPELTLDTAKLDVETCVERVVSHLDTTGRLRGPEGA